MFIIPELTYLVQLKWQFAMNATDSKVCKYIIIIRSNINSNVFSIHHSTINVSTLNPQTRSNTSHVCKGEA